MGFSAWLMKIRGFLDKFKNLPLMIRSAFSGFIMLFRDFPGIFAKKSENYGEKAGGGIKKLPATFARKIFEQGKKKPLLTGLVGLAAVLFIFLIVALVINSGNNKKPPVRNVALIPPIPPEELFIPSEPDFLPDYLFERERRNFWSLDDIRVYWKIPQNPELWKKEISSAVDKLMEGVP